VPAVRIPTVAEITKVAGLVPLPGVTLSQEEEAESVTAVKLSAPLLRVLVTLNEEDAGFAPPCVALNDRDVVERDKVVDG
jgi:hypothetical protein